MQVKLKNAVKKLYRKLLYPTHYLSELTAKRNGSVLSYYYDKKINAGDLIGPYILEELYRKPVKNCYTRSPKHILSVGSVLHEATGTSLVWGAGLLNEKYLSKKLKLENIYALRGERTRAVLEAYFNTSLKKIPLGDPAILMPNFYRPIPRKRYKLGLVPHYMHHAAVKEWLQNSDGAIVLDIQSKPEDFISKLCECEYILSSSLHGLILADSYEIPNKWMLFNENPLLGGDFKFHDYYSTTYESDQEPVVINSSESLEEVMKMIEEIATVKHLRVSPEELINALPVTEVDR